MKQSISFFFVIVCTLVLAAQEAQAKKGCNAYGHACYGGHGKRSLGTVEEEVRPDAVLQMFTSDSEGAEIDPYPRYRLIKFMKQLVGGRSRRLSADRVNDFDYPLSSSELFKDNVVN